MGKAVIFFIILLLSSSAFAENGKITKYAADINSDGKVEYLTHEFLGGSGAYGILYIYNNKGEIIFKEMVQGDPYLVNPYTHTQSLSPQFFIDLDKDGVVEILVGRQQYYDNISNVIAPWTFKSYKWNGKNYVYDRIYE